MSYEERLKLIRKRWRQRTYAKRNRPRKRRYLASEHERVTELLKVLTGND